MMTSRETPIGMWNSKESTASFALMTAVSIDEIKNSGVIRGHMKSGSTIIRLSDDKAFTTPKEIYVFRFALEDEHNFVYLKSNNNQIVYKVHSRNIEPIQQGFRLYEMPTSWSPAPENIIRTEYDKRLRMTPEAAVYVGYVQSGYVRDLFNDPKARAGAMNQYAFHYFTDWSLLFKIGGSLHYERSSFKLSGGGNVFYQAISIGPQFRTRDFEFFQTTWRLTTQIRVSPLGRMHGETTAGTVDFKFNVTDLMTTVEHPWSNGWGQFILGAFHQIQWLNMKDQPEIVSIRASNQTNQGLGLFLAQVFQ